MLAREGGAGRISVASVRSAPESPPAALGCGRGGTPGSEYAGTFGPARVVAMSSAGDEMTVDSQAHSAGRGRQEHAVLAAQPTTGVRFRARSSSTIALTILITFSFTSHGTLHVEDVCTITSPITLSPSSSPAAFGAKNSSSANRDPGNIEGRTAHHSGSTSVKIDICIFVVSSISWKMTQPVRGLRVKSTELGLTCSVSSPWIDLYVPSAIHRAPFLRYAVTRHCRRRLASPSQLFNGRLKRCMYFLSCARMETARDMARNDSACDLHHDDALPYRTNALYAFSRVRWSYSIVS